MLPSYAVRSNRRHVVAREDSRWRRRESQQLFHCAPSGFLEESGFDDQGGVRFDIRALQCCEISALPQNGCAHVLRPRKVGDPAVSQLDEVVGGHERARKIIASHKRIGFAAESIDDDMFDPVRPQPTNRRISKNHARQDHAVSPPSLKLTQVSLFTLAGAPGIREDHAVTGLGSNLLDPDKDLCE
ncbi:MAG TPA: hypothetical protein VMU65_02885 [Candidatus Saccharimonadales bacterium]|nr:hypothetical protein [Candidatus Saccharimonadales bacterium]